MAALWKKNRKNPKKDQPVREPPIGPPVIMIEQVRSPIGHPHSQREVLRGLGLRRIRHVVEREDTLAVRGMVNKVSHLVRIVEKKPGRSLPRGEEVPNPADRADD